MEERVWTFDYDQVLKGGFRMPARMTALPLPNGRIALVSPIPIDDALAKRVEALGEPAALIAPNLLHHLYLRAAHERWPNALVLAPRALAGKRPDLHIDRAIEDGIEDVLGPRLRCLPIAGAPGLDELVFFHEPSATLVVTDLVFNVTSPRGLVAHVVLFLVGAHGRLAQSRAFRFLVKDRAAAARSVRAVLSLGIARVVVAHGDIVERDAGPRLEKALAWMLRGEALSRRGQPSPAGA